MVLADLPSSAGDAIASELGAATTFVPADVSVFLSKSLFITSIGSLFL